MKTLKLFSFDANRAGFVLIFIASSLSSCKEDVEVSPDYVYIYDTTVEDVSYDSVRYEHPTILVYPNLTTVTNRIYFDRCVNIKEVLLPNLVSVGGEFANDPRIHFWFNDGLQRVEIPKLKTVFGHVDFSYNSSLDISKGICVTIDVYSYDDQVRLMCKDPSVWASGNANNNSCLSYVLHECD